MGCDCHRLVERCVGEQPGTTPHGIKWNGASVSCKAICRSPSSKGRNASTSSSPIPPTFLLGDPETLAVEVREHEPRLALDGGEDGLDVYRRLAAMLKDVVKRPKGIVALEVGAGQS